MAPVNWKRVLLGGLAFFVIYEAFAIVAWFTFIQEVWRETATRLSFADPAHLSFVAVYGALVYVSGILATWLYATARPLYGPGPKTAFVAGAAYAMVASVLPTFALAPLLHFPLMASLVTMIFGCIAIVAATMAAGWAYKDAAPAPTSVGHAAAA